MSSVFIWLIHDWYSTPFGPGMRQLWKFRYKYWCFASNSPQLVSQSFYYNIPHSAISYPIELFRVTEQSIMYLISLIALVTLIPAALTHPILSDGTTIAVRGAGNKLLEARSSQVSRLGIFMTAVGHSSWLTLQVIINRRTGWANQYLCHRIS